MKRSTSWFAVLPSLVIPVCFGMILYLGMLAMIEHQVISDQTVLRYLTGHPVSKITVAMFLIGSASLLLIGMNVFEQFRAEKKICFEPHLDNDSVDASESSVSAEELGFDHIESTNSESPVVEQAIACGQSMLRLPTWMRDHYLWERIVNALHSVYRTGSATHVEEELKYLADLDLERQQQRYSLVQILIWATPMLGFLGTVLGISQALGGITVGPDNDFQQMMDGLRGSLYVAFDTTALALTLSMIMMFGQFLVDRFESQLLQLVDQRARAEIAGQFDLSAESTKPDENAQQDLLQAVKNAAESQTDISRISIRAAELAWMSSISDVGGQVQDRFSVALDENVANLAHYLGEAIEKADTSMTHRWEQWQVLLSDNARLMTTHQTRLAEQTELIHKLLTHTEETALFEPAISKNQDAIEQTLRLRETLAELSQVVSGLAQPPAPVKPAVNDDERPEIILPDFTQIDNVLQGADVTFLKSDSPSNPEVLFALPKKAA